jgi:hypothetical protein
MDELRNNTPQLLFVVREQLLEALRIAIAPHDYGVPLAMPV